MTQLAPRYEGNVVYNVFTSAMSERDFERLSTFIKREFGINLPPTKKFMLESRLLKRLRALGIHNYGDYCDYLFSSDGMSSEVVQMIDLVTTNKTSFYREPAHYDYLRDEALPRLAEQLGAGVNRSLNVWSAGCSTGQEPYTLAMILSDYAEGATGYRYQILGSDISTRVLETARLAIYDEDDVEPLPSGLKRKYVMRSRDRSSQEVRLTPQLREHVSFRRINFMENDFSFRAPVDVLFCRNVIIYFDRATQEALLRKFVQAMAPGGYLFMGHSETLNDMNLNLRPVFPAAYRKPL
jgi:chemotaxis protein methyltransferase CheR